MRNLRMFGLALAAVFAMGAMAAPAAAANQFHSAAVNTTITRSANATQFFQYQSGGETVECSTVGGSGEVSGTQTVGEVEFAPTYSTCKMKGVPFSSVEVHMNGCEYLFTIELSSNSGAVGLECPATEIELEVLEFGVHICTYFVPQQTPSGVADYANSGTTKIIVQPTQTGIHATMVPITMGGTGCGKTSSTTGSYTGQVQVKGEETGGTTEKAIQVG